MWGIFRDPNRELEILGKLAVSPLLNSIKKKKSIFITNLFKGYTLRATFINAKATATLNVTRKFL